MQISVESILGTRVNGFHSDLSGAFHVGDIVYSVANARNIPIKMSLPGYEYILVRSRPGGADDIARIVHHHEVDRFEDMRIEPPPGIDSERANATANLFLADLRSLSLDPGTYRNSSHKLPAPEGRAVPVTPRMFCGMLYEASVAMTMLKDNSSRGVLTYRSPRTPIGQWWSLDLDDGMAPYAQEVIQSILDEESAHGIDPTQVVIGNRWFVPEAPTLAQLHLQQTGEALNP